MSVLTENGLARRRCARVNPQGARFWGAGLPAAGAALALGLAALTAAGVPANAQTQQPDPQAQSQPQLQPGQEGNWGPAGPPPDAQNGRIPSEPSSSQTAEPPASQASPQSASQPRGVGVSPESGAVQPAPPPPVGPGAAEAGSPQAQPPQPEQYPQASRRAPYRRPQQQWNPPASEAAPSGPVTLEAGTLLRVRTDQPLDLRKLQPGDYFDATIAQNIYSGSALAIPRGAAVTGRVVDVRKPGEIKGSSSLTLEIASLQLGGRSYPLATSTWVVNGPGKGAYTTGNTVGAAALGAVIGAVAGGGAGAAVGAVAGGALGLGASAATSGPRGAVPPEALLNFHLTRPATIQPVSIEEARNLEQNSEPPETRRPRRGWGPYGPPRPPYPYPYAYAYPYPYGYVYPYPYRYYPYWR